MPISSGLMNAIAHNQADPYDLQRKQAMEDMLRNGHWEVQDRLGGVGQGVFKAPRARVTLKQLLNNGIYTAPTDSLLDMWVARFGDGWVSDAALKDDGRDLFNELRHRGVPFAQRDAYDEDADCNVLCVRPQKFIA